MHIPMAILANRAYSSHEITSEELLKRLEDSHEILKRSLKMLLLEPISTPEGQLAKRALQEIKLIAQNIEDVKFLEEKYNNQQNPNVSRKIKNKKSK